MRDRVIRGDTGCGEGEGVAEGDGGVDPLGGTLGVGVGERVGVGVGEVVGGGLGGLGHVIRLTSPLPPSVTSRDTTSARKSMAIPRGVKCEAVREEVLSRDTAAPVPLRVVTMVGPGPVREMSLTLLDPLSVTARNWS